MAEFPASTEKGQTPKGRPTYLVYHNKNTLVYTQFRQLFAFILMEYPILKNPERRCMMKLQKRSESNVLSKLPPIKNLQKEEVTQMTEPDNI